MSRRRSSAGPVVDKALSQAVTVGPYVQAHEAVCSSDSRTTAPRCDSPAYPVDDQRTEVAVRQLSVPSSWAAVRSYDPTMRGRSRVHQGQPLCNTAAPLNRPCARSLSAPDAAVIGYAAVVARTPSRSARTRYSSPSRRVLAVTVRSVRSPTGSWHSRLWECLRARYPRPQGCHHG